MVHDSLKWNETNSQYIPLRTGSCYIRHFCVDYCALQELLMTMNFTLEVAPPIMHNDVTSGHAHHSAGNVASLHV